MVDLFPWPPSLTARLSLALPLSNQQSTADHCDYYQTIPNNSNACLFFLLSAFINRFSF